MSEKRIIIAGGPSGGDGAVASEVPTDLLDLTIMGEDFDPDESVPYERAIIVYDEDSPARWKLAELIPWYVQSSSVMLPSGFDLNTDDGDVIVGSGLVDGVDVSDQNAKKIQGIDVVAGAAVPVANEILYFQSGVGWKNGYDTLVSGGGYSLSLAQKTGLTDGGTTTLHAHGMKLEVFYDSTGNQSLTSTATTVNLDSSVFGSSQYTLASNEITFNGDGKYEIRYDVAWDETSLAGGANGTIKFWLEDDSGGSYAATPGSYNRTYIEERVYGAGISGGTIVALSNGDKVRLRAQQFSAGPAIDTAANEVSVKIKKVGI